MTPSKDKSPPKTNDAESGRETVAKEEGCIHAGKLIIHLLELTCLEHNRVDKEPGLECRIQSAGNPVPGFGCRIQNAG